MATKQVLQIDYQEDHGLMLQWKYTDLSLFMTFFRHIIVLFSDNKQRISKFLKTYIKRMRPGDLYSVMYQDHKNNLKASTWRQKMLCTQPSILDNIIKGNPIIGNKEAILEKAEKQFGVFSEPIVVTIYTENSKDRDWVESRIKAERCNQNYDFIVGMFGPFKSAHFSTSNDITVIPFATQQDHEAVQFYLNEIYQSAVMWASVSIQCINGSINSNNQSNWKNINFNTIERIYRGPSIKYEKDVLMFYRQKLKQVDYNLMLKLTYVTLQGRKYFSQKLFSVHSFEPYQNSIYSAPISLKPYYAFGDVWLDLNPFRTITVLKFEPQNADQCQ